MTLTFERRVLPKHDGVFDDNDGGNYSINGNAHVHRDRVTISPMPSPVRAPNNSSTISINDEVISAKEDLNNALVLEKKNDTIEDVDERDEEKYVAMEAQSNANRNYVLSKEDIAIDDDIAGGGDVYDNVDDYVDDGDDDDYNDVSDLPPPPPYPYDDEYDGSDTNMYNGGEDRTDDQPFINAIMLRVDETLYQARKELELAQLDAIKYAQLSELLRVENDTLKDTVKSLVSDLPYRVIFIVQY